MKSTNEYKKSLNKYASPLIEIDNYDDIVNYSSIFNKIRIKLHIIKKITKFSPNIYQIYLDNNAKTKELDLNLISNITKFYWSLKSSSVIWSSRSQYFSKRVDCFFICRSSSI